MTLLDVFCRFVGAVLCAFAALALWGIDSRAPWDAARDAVRTASRGGGLARGLLRALSGALCAVLALLLIEGTLPRSDFDLFAPYAIGAFLAGLVVEALVGDAFRRLFGLGAPRPRQR